MRLGVVTTSHGHFVAAHARALAGLGHDVEVLGANVVDSPLFRAGGAPDLLEANRGAWLHAASFTARLAVRVQQRARRWDAIVAHWLAPSALVALPTTIPLLAIAHGGDIYTLRRIGLLPTTLRLLAWRGAELVFVAEHLKRACLDAAPALRTYLETARVQPMGVELARFAAERQPTDELVAVARLVPIKGLDVAIEAARISQRPLAIVGAGPERARLEHQAAGAPVRFVGGVSTDEIPALLARAAAVVIPSRELSSGRTEGTPAIALEALAAGAPVIASRVGGLAALDGVRHIEAGNVRELAAAIRDVTAQPPPATAQRAAVAHLDWRHVAPALQPRLRGA